MPRYFLKNNFFLLDPIQRGPLIYISNLSKFSDRIMKSKINWLFVQFSPNFRAESIQKPYKLMPSERWHCLLDYFQQENTRRLRMFSLQTLLSAIFRLFFLPEGRHMSSSTLSFQSFFFLFYKADSNRNP